MFEEFNTRGMPEAARAKQWQEACASTFCGLETSIGDPRRFFGHIRAWKIGESTLINFSSEPSRYTRLRHHVQPDAEETILGTFSGQSSIAFEQHGIHLLCKKSQFYIERTYLTADYLHTEFNDVWFLKTPTAALKRHIHLIDPFCFSLFNAETGIGRLFFDLMVQVPMRLNATPPAAIPGLEHTLLDLLVLALQADDRAILSSRSSVQRGHLARIEQYARRNLDDPRLSAEQIANACQISVRYIHTLFQGSGTTLSQWVREMRLEACRSELCQPTRRESVCEIAYRWGFADQANFSRQFRARYGTSPREMRAEAWAQNKQSERVSGKKLRTPQ